MVLLRAPCKTINSIMRTQFSNYMRKTALQANSFPFRLILKFKKWLQLLNLLSTFILILMARDMLLKQQHHLLV